MNILIIQQAPDLGGAELYLVDLVKRWSESGNQVTTYTNYEPLRNLFSKNGAKSDILPFNLDIMGNIRGFVKTLLMLPLAIPWYRGTLKLHRDNVDVILSAGQTEKLLMTLVAGRKSPPIVWLEYPPMERLLKRNLGIPKFIYKLLAKKARRIITISQHTKKSLTDETKIDARNIRLVYPGSEIADRKELLRSQRAANAIRKSLGIGRKRVIGNISRIAQEKGQEYLLRAYELVKKSHPRTALVLAGRGPDEDRLKRLADRRNIRDVFFTGFVEDRNAMLALSDVFVFPAAWELEGFGIVLVEAMLARKPIVAVKHGPVAEILEDGKHALLVKNQDPKQLAKAILKLLSHPGYAGKLAKRAQERARENFAIKDSAVRMLNQLREATRKT